MSKSNAVAIEAPDIAPQERPAESVDPTAIMQAYRDNLIASLSADLPDHIGTLCEVLNACRGTDRTVYLCGNGGSSANAVHIANDLCFVDGKTDGAVRVEALTANAAIMTCIANDFAYEDIFAQQLAIKAKAGDVLIALSGSGNSANIVRAIDIANQRDMETFAVLGFGGGKCQALAKYPIHFAVNDMQIAEDLQLVVGHICMRYLKEAVLAEERHG